MKKILLIEDDRDQALALAIRLRKNGYVAVLAEDALQGVTLARASKPDLITLDLGLPAGGGFTLLENARHIMDTALIPVIVLTARDPAVHRERALQLGASVYFQKPADNEELLAAIARLIEPAAPVANVAAPPSRVKREQVRQWREILRQMPADPVTLNDLAWVLATARDPGLRDVAEAVRIAAQLLKIVAPEGTPPHAYRQDEPELVMAVLDTLAVVCAADGRFDEAVRLARDAWAITLKLGQQEAAREIAGRIQLYEGKTSLFVDYP